MLCVLIRSTSDEYPQHMFSWINKKNIKTFGMKKASYQELYFLIKKIKHHIKSYAWYLQESINLKNATFQ